MVKINLYICDAGHRTVTRNELNKHPPIFTTCREGNCQLQAVQQLGKVDQSLEPTFEWYNPSDKEVKDQMREMLDSKQVTKEQYDKAWNSYQRHVKAGGMLLRKIKNPYIRGGDLH